MYSPNTKFNYIRYNSLPSFADFVLDYDKSYYDGWGIDITHNLTIGIDLEKVSPYSKIFVKTDLIENYLDILQKIPVPYHLLTGVSDIFLENSLIEKILKTKIVSWCGNNLAKYDERFLQVPIGFCEKGSQRPNAFTEYVELSEEKIIDLVVTPFTETHSERKDLSNLYGRNILNISNKIDYSKFLTVLGLSRYSCCPRGNGYDTHRVIESILMNSIPIVKSSPLDPLYKELGAVIVNEWGDSKYLNFAATRNLNREVLTEEYWKCKITTHQQTMSNNKFNI